MNINKHMARCYLIVLITLFASQSLSAQLGLSIIQDSIPCFGLSTQVAVSATSGTPPYQYKFDSSGYTGVYAVDSFYNLPAGTYTFFVQDANSNIASATLVRVQPSVPLTATYSVTAPTCFGYTDASIASAGSGGTPYAGQGGTTSLYLYTWLDSNLTPFFTDSVVTNLPSGIYALAVEDYNACFDTTFNIVVTQPAQMVGTILSVVQPTCFGYTDGSINAVASGGTPYTGQGGVLSSYLYTWLDSSKTAIEPDSMISGIGSGFYNLAFEDYNGCRDTLFNFLLNQPTALSATIISLTKPTCNGYADGEIEIAASGGTIYPASYGLGNYNYTYLDSTGTPFDTDSVASGLIKGTYTLAYEDFNGCRDTLKNIIVNEPTVLSASIISLTQPTCFGLLNGQIQTAATGGTSFPAIYASGNYVYTYLDAMQNTIDTDSLASGIGAGIYALAIEDFNGCRDTLPNIIVTQPALLTQLITATNVNCNGANDASISVATSGGTQFVNAPVYITNLYNAVWSSVSSSSSTTALSAGIYYSVVVDSNGCRDTSAAISITQPAAVVLTASATNVSCHGQANATINASASAAAVITVNSLPYLASANYAPGTYTVSASIANGNNSGFCTDSSVFTIIEPALVTLNASATNVTCNGAANGGITASAAGGATIKVNGNAYNASALYAPGTYTVIASAPNGNNNGFCTDTIELIITEPAAVTVDITTANSTVGVGSSLSLEAIGTTATYLWNGPGIVSSTSNPLAVTANLNNTGTFTVTATDASGCTASSTIEVEVLNGVLVEAKVALSGNLQLSGLMSDQLRFLGYLPNSDPYRNAPYAVAFTHVLNPIPEVVDPGVLNSTTNPVVDWVFVELRNKSNRANVLATRSALLRADGAIVDMDGTSPVLFSNTSPDSFFVAVRHRNHLGISALAKQGLSLNSTSLINMSSLSVPLYIGATASTNNSSFGGGAARTLYSKRAMYAGNCGIVNTFAASTISYATGSTTDRNAMLAALPGTTVLSQYSIFDCNLDGVARYQGLTPDRLVILTNCNNSNTLIVYQQLP
jgi:hypothetical protein